jgi:predicted SnoaL-like aldol condensation-catalyzing enzyme
MTLQADRALEAANKATVLAMWHAVIDGRDFAAAARYIAPDYRQHSPSADQGLDSLIAFLRVELGDEGPRAPGSYPLTQFAHVIAEGDLVQLMFRRPLPDPHVPGRTVEVWWYDTYRLRDGMIVEHWDCAIE